MKRRNFLKVGLKAGALIGFASQAGAAIVCGKTPAQTEGPFYPILPQEDTDWDLTTIVNNTKRAHGEEIIIIGQVVDQYCKPISSVLVEIWQACASGKYNHPQDPNTAVLDPNFQYWGRCLTNENGFYLFRTILPGAYPADENWVRPPHIHYKAHKRGLLELTTQLYFSGNSLNETDKILLRIPKTERSKVICPILTREIDIPGEGIQLAKVVQFDISMEKL